MSRSEPEAADVGEALERLGDRAAYFCHDLQDVAGHGQVLDRVEERLGPVTTFVSNAGVPAKVRGDMLDLRPDSFDFVLGVNLRGAFFLAQDVARRMLKLPEDTYRSITFVTSVSATMVSIERAEYCLSKAGAAMMAELFRRPACSSRHRRLRAAAGHHRNRHDRRREGQVYRADRGRSCSCRTLGGQPADIGSIILPIAEGRMAFATGSSIAVDGGLSIPRL
ncbi:SDR family oxidoreductase [Roseibium salinum]|nr:SDR family oxidoreductase [Roseibium salinum]